VNKKIVPFVTESTFITSGIRVGTSAITSRGINHSEILTIVDLIDRVLSNIGDESVIDSVRKEVNALMSHRPLFKW